MEQADTFQKTVENATALIGRQPLSDDEICTLACAEITRTYTYEEKGYSRQ
jgi:hypothetical protein